MTIPTQPPRRAALAWAATTAAALAALAVLPGCASAATPRYTIGARELQQALATRFPRRYPLAGVLEVELQAPALKLLPERNLINAVLDLQAIGLLLQGRQPSGVLDLDFGLRYEPSDHTIRADRLQVNALRVQGLPPALAQNVARYGVPLAQQALQDAVLHQLRPKDLALAGTLGVQPGAIRITPAGIVVDFANRSAAR
ncbi:DUF1439 domain-containing protein [Pulveribacter suum]|uniref:DUF1439 domain-containing protein n=1 Tax=Pulveribacter suum TaxID=2116657 RepID=A0A2P1NH89_9BURK|nr:DUF1439 domain-containing protein [Pulveribacter suum]AVP56414.1 DUF1439 domain-containing protein [Pulveribacter suum]